ncbi:MAG TPA: hypothetical protein VM686_41820 [Polyangiaceae bacterium]|nr:hypothetical protein [Polyangiaceae bacterium]
MRSCLKLAALVWALPALLTARSAFAEDPPPEAKTEDAKPKEEAFKPPSGYQPGSSRAIGLGLSPYAPRTPTMPGGATVPYGAPQEEPGMYELDFSGYMSAALRLSSGGRDRATPGQFEGTFYAPPQTPDFYGAVQGTNAPLGSWVELRFDYGNPVVKSVVKLSTWKPSRGQTWQETSSQNFVNEAFLLFTLPDLGDFSVNWTVGAFRNIYGTLGQYGAGQYNAAIIGAPFGVGETLSLKYGLSDSFSLVLEHGLMGRLGKVPIGAGPNSYDHGPSAAKPSSFVNHLHAGFSLLGETPFQGGLHYISNFAMDERDQFDDPKTPFLDERVRPDPKLDVYGVDLRMIDNYLGNAAVAVSYADANNAELLTGFNYYGADTGELLTRRLLGQRGGGTGKLLIIGAEYNLSWSKLLYYPEAFWGDGPDLITSVFANAGFTESEDPEFDGRKLYKFGAEVTYRMLPWFAVSGRADRVAPNSKDSEETFHVISPKLIFRSNWNSHEHVTLSYTRWFYGPHTKGEAPNDFTHEELDDQMFALNFGMWW